jgi:hypothetical protein
VIIDRALCEKAFFASVTGVSPDDFGVSLGDIATYGKVHEALGTLWSQFKSERGNLEEDFARRTGRRPPYEWWKLPIDKWEEG